MMYRLTLPPLRRLAHRIGRRGCFLLFLSILDLIYGYAIAFPTARTLATPTYAFLADVLPLTVWGAIWAGTGIVCFVTAFTRHDSLGFACAMFLKVFWSLTFLLGWLFVGVERAYLSSVIWGSFAAVLALIATWPEAQEANR